MAMTYSKVQTVGLAGGDRKLFCASASEEETATQSPRSTANSFTTSSVETPQRSGTSRDSRVTADDEDSDSCTDEDSSSSQEQHDDYYAFLREFAGSDADAGDEEEEEDLESERGSQDGGDRNEKQEEVFREVQPHPRKRSCAHTSDEVDSLLTSTPSAGSRVPRDGGHRETRSSSKDDSFDDSDAGSESEDDETLGEYLQDNSRDASSDKGKFSGEYPSPEDDDYDVVKAVQHYASQRPGNRMQHWCEDMQEAIRLRRMQAYHLAAVVAKRHADPKVLAHFARVRIELLMEAKAIETRLSQVAGPVGDARVPSARPQDSLLSSGGSVR